MGSDFSNLLTSSGIIFHEVPIKRGLKPVNAYRSVSRIIKIIKQHEFEIIHTHTPTGGLVGRIAARWVKHKKVFHTTAGLYFHENMPTHKYKFFSSIERFLTSKTQILFSPNHEDIKTCKDLNIKPLREIVYCGPAGVDLKNFEMSNKQNVRQAFAKQLEISEDVISIGLIARLEYEKGYKEFIDVIERLALNGKNVIGISVGDGRDKEQIVAYASEKKESTIKFLGYRNDVPEIMQALDILLFPSYREGLPIVTLEAMASKVPVVAYDIRGCRESIDNNVTGFLVPFGNNDELYNKTESLVIDEILREKLGLNGRDRVERLFTREMHVKRQLHYYEQYI